MDNFDLRKFLAENKLTTNSRLNEEAFDITKEVQLGDVLVDVQGDMYEVVAISPSQVELEPFNFKGDNSIFPDDFGNDVSIEDFWQHLTAREEEEPKGPFGEPWDTNYFGNHIKESKPLKENTFKVGQKVTYLGHPAVVTATKEYNGRNFVSVSYDKGTGKRKASNILATSGDVKPVNEEVGGLESIKAKLEADPKNEYLNFIHEPERDQIRVGGKEGAKHDFVLRNEKEDFGSYELFNIDDDDRGLIVHISRKK